MDTGKVIITRGENAVFTIKLRDTEGDPFDISGFDKFSVCLPLADGEYLEVTEVANTNGSIVILDGDGTLGRLQVQLKAADTLTLRVDERMDLGLELNVAASADPRRKVFKNVLTVEDFPC